MARTRYRFGDEHYPHFLTQTIVAWLPIFSRPDLVDIVLDSWRFLQRERGIVILAWVILENHLHWIGAGPQHWRYSSARDYAGKPGLLDVCVDWR